MEVKETHLVEVRIRVWNDYIIQVDIPNDYNDEEIAKKALDDFDEKNEYSIDGGNQVEEIYPVDEDSD